VRATGMEILHFRGGAGADDVTGGSRNDFEVFVNANAMNAGHFVL
jgi:hypothetical protein